MTTPHNLPAGAHDDAADKAAIFEALRQNTREVFPRPDLSELEQHALHFPDRVAQMEKVLAEVGGRAVTLAGGETAGAAIARLYPDARRTACAVADLPGADLLPGEVFDPAALDDAAQLNGTDLAIIEARIGVCENGCCWIEQHGGHRAVEFISEALVIVLRREALVDTMHEAYRQLPDDRSVPFACFISGPSKTADIEQALVIGAHGARDVTVLIV